MKYAEISLTGLQSDINDVSSFVKKYQGLNKENKKLSFPKGVKTVELSTEIVPGYNYSAKITIQNPNLIDIGTITPVPEIIKENILPEIVDWGKTIDLTNNIKNLPEGAKVVDITNPAIDTKKSGEYTGKVEVEFKDGSKRKVDIPVTVNKSQAEEFTPKVIPEIVDQGGKIDLTNNIKNLPDDLIVKDITNPVINITKSGEYKGKVEVTFPDGSKRIVEIPVIVKENTTSTPVPQPTYPTSNFIQGEITIIDRTKEETDTKYDKNEEKSYWVFKIGELDYKFVTKETETRYTADVKPFIKDDRAYLPFRFVGKALNIDVGYDNATRLATFTKGTNHLEINIDTGKATKNKLAYNLETNPMLVNSRLVAPVSVIGKAFNKTVSNYKENKDTDIVWNPETQEVIIYNYK